jgi:allantoin racemase|tara:strand:+ start:24954 stop:25718 length:765 start_codon:yes stop_codon:yes gene_type:complete
MKQVLVIVPFPMTDANLMKRQDQLSAVKLDSKLNFTFKSVIAAPRNYVSSIDMALADLGIFNAGRNAEKDGYDAVCIDTMSDSGVAALRSVLSIPVVGPGRVSMLMAMTLGNHFSILTMWQKWRHLYEKTLNDLGLHHACVSIRSIDVAPDNLSLLSGKEENIFPLLLTEARAAIDQDRADVIVLGSTTMHQSHGYLSNNLDVPVINPGPLSYKIIETLLGLGLSHSRIAYPTSPVSREAMIDAMMEVAAKFDH